MPLSSLKFGENYWPDYTRYYI